MEQFAKQVELAYQEHYYLILSIRVIAGILFGLIPLIWGIKKGKRNLGIVSFIVSLVVGIIAPILLLITTPIFIWLILRKPKAVEADDSANSSETTTTND